MLSRTSERLASMHRAQVHRAPWPDFDAFDRGAYDAEIRRAAAAQWAGRARAEHGSVQQFTALAHALTEARAPLEMLGALARLITDEVRHAELCARMALACWPEGVDDESDIFRWPSPRAPFGDAPRLGEGDDIEPIFAWAAEAIVIACCIGETLSRPMLEAISVVSTDPLAEAVARQILRDEHLHAAFGFEALRWIWARSPESTRERARAGLPRWLGAFERSTACGISIEEVASTEIAIEAGTPDRPNLGTLRDLEYAMIFYSTMEHEVIPGLEAIGLGALDAWRARPRRTST